MSGFTPCSDLSRADQLIAQGYALRTVEAMKADYDNGGLMWQYSQPFRLDDGRTARIDGALEGLFIDIFEGGTEGDLTARVNLVARVKLLGGIDINRDCMGPTFRRAERTDWLWAARHAVLQGQFGHIAA